jgi:cyclopropane-fatty-acyl-phospholipid synthase
MAWHANISAAWDDIGDRYDERFRRMWNFYLLSSAGAFRARSNQLWQVVLSRDGLAGTYRPDRIR